MCSRSAILSLAFLFVSTIAQAQQSNSQNPCFIEIRPPGLLALFY
jgi:hypothetical protein